MNEINKEQRLEQLRESAEWKALEGIDTQALRDELEGEYPWFLIDASVDLIENGKEEIVSALTWQKVEPEKRPLVLDPVIQNYIKRYTPRGWQEPVGVPTHGAPFDLRELLAKKISDAIDAE